MKIFNLRCICRAYFEGTKENSKEFAIPGGKNWIPKARVTMEGFKPSGIHG